MSNLLRQACEEAKEKDTGNDIRDQVRKVGNVFFLLMLKSVPRKQYMFNCKLL